MFWSDKLVNKKKCPLCHTTLEKEYHHYMMAIRSGKETTSLTTGNDCGAFCPECPIVILDRKRFEQIIEETAERPDWGISGAVQYVVLGVVNLDAIPEDKRHLPIGGDDNPIPLVEFLNETDMANRGASGRHKVKRLSGNQRRRHLLMGPRNFY
jgi:hypothetical protein